MTTHGACAVGGQGCRLCRPRRERSDRRVSPPYALLTFRGTFYNIMSKVLHLRGALRFPMAHP